MAQLDNYDVLRNDHIFDIVYGSGTVIAVNSGSFVARFPSGKTLNYSPNGIIAGAKRAYWNNPIFLVPYKNQARWEKLKNTVVNVIDLIQEAQEP